VSEPQYRPVLFKRDFVRRYSLGEFGNRSPTWDTFDEWRNFVQEAYSSPDLAQESSQRYHLRNRVAGGATHYDLSAYSAYARWQDQADRTQWYLSEMAPTEKTLFQGEVVETEQGLTLFYSTVAKPMRESLALGGTSVKGVLVTMLLRRYLCPNSLDWLYTLLERYPEHVVEFSTYATNWGTLPRFNTVFWEVRKY